MDVLITRIPGLRRADLERWIAHDWVRADGPPGAQEFHAVDVARITLIAELRDELRVDEEALPVVLLLLDQLYDLRRRMRQLGEAIERTAPRDVREALMRHLAGTGS